MTTLSLLDNTTFGTGHVEHVHLGGGGSVGNGLVDGLVTVTVSGKLYVPLIVETFDGNVWSTALTIKAAGSHSFTAAGAFAIRAALQGVNAPDANTTPTPVSVSAQF